MPEKTAAPTSSTPFFGSAARAAGAQGLQAQGMEELRNVLQETNEENLRLHRQTLKTITAMRREMERVKRSLRNLATARS